MKSEELAAQLEVWHRLRAVADGNIVQILGEVMRREDFRSDGATSPEDWQVERFGLSVASARNYSRVAERVMDLPHLTRALSTGDISLDKMRAVVGLATPETDRELARLRRPTHGGGAGRAGRIAPTRTGRRRRPREVDSRRLDALQRVLPHHVGAVPRGGVRRGAGSRRGAGEGIAQRRRDALGSEAVRRLPWALPGSAPAPARRAGRDQGDGSEFLLYAVLPCTAGRPDRRGR